MRILVIEDNIKTANYLCDGLNENYFVAEAAYNGQEGFFLASQKNYDAIIVDVMLPQLDGWTLVKMVREVDSQVPILFLTARDHLNDKIKGFELGADDYLIKPFAFSELLARIRSLLKRKQPISLEVLQVGDLVVDIVKHKVKRSGINLYLSAKEFMLLVLLMQRKGEVLSRTFIAEQVWDINFDTDTNAIDVAIKRLRDKVDGDCDSKLIHTVRGVGYVFEER